MSFVSFLTDKLLANHTKSVKSTLPQIIKSINPERRLNWKNKEKSLKKKKLCETNEIKILV